MCQSSACIVSPDVQTAALLPLILNVPVPLSPQAEPVGAALGACAERSVLAVPVNVSEPTPSVATSVAVSDCVPAVLRVAENVPTPAVSTDGSASTAWLSLLVNTTVLA